VHKIYSERLVSPKILDVLALLKLDSTDVKLNTFEAFITFFSKFKEVISPSASAANAFHRGRISKKAADVS